MKNFELATNPNTPPETLAVLATDKESYVRWRVAYNPNTPPETLAVLATDNDSCVRYGVAQNPNATEEIIIEFNAYEKYGHLVNCHSSST
jgi:Leucine rich repeat variant